MKFGENRMNSFPDTQHWSWENLSGQLATIIMLSSVVNYLRVSLLSAITVFLPIILFLHILSFHIFLFLHILSFYHLLLPTFFLVISLLLSFFLSWTSETLRVWNNDNSWKATAVHHFLLSCEDEGLMENFSDKSCFLWNSIHNSVLTSYARPEIVS